MKRFVVLACLLWLATPAAAEPRTITLEEAIDLATKQNALVEIGEGQVEIAELQKDQTKTFRLPSIALRGSVQLWNDEIIFELPGPDPDPMDMEPPPLIPVTVRPYVTASADLTVAQPISALFLIPSLIEGDEAAIAGAKAELEKTRLDVALQTATLYLNALQAETLRQSAEESVKNLEANLERVRALRRADVVGDVDVLRIESFRDAAKQQVLEAETSAAVARNALVLQLDLPQGTELALAPVDLTPPELRWTEEEAIAKSKRRPEVKVIEAQIEQAQTGIDLAKAEYIPDVNAVAVFNYAAGAGTFGAPQAAFVGLTLDWTIWDWGRRGKQVDQSRARKKIATRSRDLTMDAMATEVRNKWLLAEARKETLAVSESALKASAEAHRLQNVRFNEGAATTTEVLDAEVEVSRARAQATVSRYQYLIAWMELVRAVGEEP